MGFNPSSEFNVGLSLKNAFEQYHPLEGKGALDSYAEKISNSSSLLRKDLNANLACSPYPDLLPKNC